MHVRAWTFEWQYEHLSSIIAFKIHRDCIHREIINIGLNQFFLESAIIPVGLKA